ncbi:RluA family pseudouridine synthase [Desulfothermus okinawensis JCM 13304]
MDNSKIRHIKVNSRSSGRKLFQFLEDLLDKQVPRSALMKWIRTGQVRVDGKRAKPFDRLEKGQVVRIPPFKIDKRNILDEQDQNPFVLKKIHEDKEFLVLYKPPNLATQPGKNIEDSLFHRLKREYPENTPFLVHRLDKETSGIIIVAKTFEYLKHLQNLFLSNRIQKIYLAWVQGNTQWDNWSMIKDNFIEHRDSKKKRVEAISFIKTLKNTQGYSLVAVLIKTGRKHQIRIQLSLRNHPIVGDLKYSKVKSRKNLLLHSYLMKWDSRLFSFLPKHWRGRFKVDSSDVAKIYPLPL